MINDDLKKTGTRVARQINKTLQRSKMNPILKPYFTESSIKFVDNSNFTGFVLNETALDNEYILSNIDGNRYTNNLKFLSETVNKILKKEGLKGTFKLETYSNGDEKIKGTNKSRFMHCYLEVGPAEVTAETDLNNNTTLTDLGRTNSYYIAPEKEASHITKEFMDEISNIGNDNPRPVKPNHMETIVADIEDDNFNDSDAAKILGLNGDDNHTPVIRSEDYSLLN